MANAFDNAYIGNSANEKGYVHNGPEDNHASGGMHNYNGRTTCWATFSPRSRTIIVGIIVVVVLIVVIVPTVVITQNDRNAVGDAQRTFSSKLFSIYKYPTIYTRSLLTI